MTAAHAARQDNRRDSDDPGTRLAERLEGAWIAAGRPSMGDVGDVVGYSRASISNVLAGTAPPTWHLVRKLGGALGVPADTVEGEWHSLWSAADDRRHRPAGPETLPQRRPFTGPDVLPQRRRSTGPDILPQRQRSTGPDVLPQRRRPARSEAAPEARPSADLPAATRKPGAGTTGDDPELCRQCDRQVVDLEIHQLWHERISTAETPKQPDALVWARLRDAVGGRDARAAAFGRKK